MLCIPTEELMLLLSEADPAERGTEWKKGICQVCQSLTSIGGIYISVEPMSSKILLFL